jgi:hypothetical protein
MKNIFKFSEKLRKGSSVATYSNAGVKTEKRVHNRFCTAIGAALLVLCLFILWGGGIFNY